MRAVDLLSNLESRGIRLESDGNKLRFHPINLMTPEIKQQLIDHKVELMELIVVDDEKNNSQSYEKRPLNSQNSIDENDFFWQQINQTDRDYLTQPRSWPEPCPWCGGRKSHSVGCESMQADWLPTIKFGKHKGKRIDEVDRNYLGWILSNQAGTDHFRSELLRWLENQKVKSP